MITFDYHIFIMKKTISFNILLLFTVLIASAQQFTLETALDATVNETSGLLYINNTLITHNDSDNTNQLFDIDTATGAVLRTVTVTNATNVDWEDLAHDGTYIYIGDFGNSNGDRTDLIIYRILISDYLANTSVTADIINYSYSDQVDFTPSPFATNFDAEGLIHFNNVLYVFTKNWLNGNTNIYELPKTPGTYSINMVDTINAQGLVSGATYNGLDNSIFLCGYDVNGAFLIQLSGYNSGLFSNGAVIKTTIAAPTNFSPQIEGIIPIAANEYYVSAEENNPTSPGLYSFNISTLEISDLKRTEISFYPNPAKNSITLNRDNLNTEIYNITGQLVKSSTQKEIDISELNIGVYLLRIKDLSSGNSTTRRLIIDR